MAYKVLWAPKIFVSKCFSFRLPSLGVPSNSPVFILFQGLFTDKYVGTILQLAALRISSIFAIFHAKYFGFIFRPGKLKGRPVSCCFCCITTQYERLSSEAYLTCLITFYILYQSKVGALLCQIANLMLFLFVDFTSF